MRLRFYLKYLLLLASLSIVPMAHAQEDAPIASAEILDETDEPAITIRKPDINAEIVERRNGGMVDEIKVTSGPSTYYLYPNGKNGVPDSFESNLVRPALWKVGEFDVTKRKKKIGDENDPMSSDVPPPAGE
ncbi:MAG: hypothetical protein IK089_03020 [Oxalobacter sp.]|jgi:hypothetical protein|nr:hypothetical protein [Oxalobacter sp.]MBR6000208.1 hypothetical protein [Oxalobacter sp.]